MSTENKKVMNAMGPLANSINNALSAVAGQGVGFVLIVLDNAVPRYVSNLPREHGKELLRTVVDRLGQEVSTSPAANDSNVH